jgi:hypothetical protein
LIVAIRDALAPRYYIGAVPNAPRPTLSIQYTPTHSLLPGDEEPIVELNSIFHAFYSRARFDLRLNCAKPPVPPLREEDVEWAKELQLRME